MGVYEINCVKCDKVFKWFSGHPDSQMCSDCEEIRLEGLGILQLESRDSKMREVQKAPGIKGYITDFKIVRIRKGKFAFDIAAIIINEQLLVDHISVFQLEEDGKFWVVPNETADNLIDLIELTEPLFLIQSVKEALE